MNILNPQPTVDNPHIVEDYPYGFTLRTQMRVYTEFRKGFGFRYVTQTLNPKTGKWNKPKAGNYYDIVLVYIDPADGYVKQKAFQGYNEDEFTAFAEFIGDSQILEQEPYKTQFRIAGARRNVQSKMVWKVVPANEARPVSEQLQDINRAINYEYSQLVKNETQTEGSTVLSNEEKESSL